jgi:hypothetical protein
MQNIARQNQERRFFGKGYVEDPPGRVVGGIQQKLAEMIGNLAETLRRTFQMEVARMNEAERAARHGLPSVGMNGQLDRRFNGKFYPLSRVYATRLIENRILIPGNRAVRQIAAHSSLDY